MRPKSNGLIELVDEKSQDRGFFCMKLVGFIMAERKEKEERTLAEQGFAMVDVNDLWQLRFSEAKAGNCAYKLECPIYAKTMAKQKKQPVQLSIFNF